MSKTSYGLRGRCASVTGIVLGLALTACSSAPELPEFKKWDFSFTSPDLNVFAPKENSVTAVTAQDLVTADGHCAGEAPTSQALNFQAGPQVGGTANNGAPAIPAPDARSNGGGIALNMTECDIVRAAGPTNRVEIGTNERGQRNVLLTYAQGERAGIYRFVAGRLVSIERNPDAVAPAKPKTKTKAKKPAQNSANS